MDCFGHPWPLPKNFAGKIEMLEVQEYTASLIESETEKTRLGLNMLRKHLKKKLQRLLF
jgi:hypothetical protein